MTASSVGSNVFFALSVVVICALVLLLLRYYVPLRTTPFYLLLPVYLAIALPASIILLVPIDLASTSETDTSGSRGIWLPQIVLLKAWRVTYWLTFALTWFILPLLGEYCDAGYREPVDRLKYSFYSNGRYQLIMLASGVVGAIYFIINSGFHFASLQALIMALAYAWGLVLAIYLMGHGLVSLPRWIYRNASIAGRLKMYQSHAPKTHDRLMDAIDALDQVEHQVLQLCQRKNGIAREFQDWIDELAETGTPPESGSTRSLGLRGPPPTVPNVITERYMAELSRKLKRARHKKMRFLEEWSRLCRAAINTQAILDSTTSKKLEFKEMPYASGIFSKFTLLTPYTRYLVHVHLIPAVLYIISFIFGLASVAISWSEVVKSLNPKLSVVGLTVVHHPNSSRGKIGFAGQAFAAMWMLYMCATALFSITEVKIWGNRALVPRHTYSESACWYSLQVAKLTVPLAYNFVTFVPPNIYKHTSFHEFLGARINFTPLGNGFSSYFPILILIPVCATLFNLYRRIKNTLGFGDLLDDTDEGDEIYGTGSWREGRALIEREVHGVGGNVLNLSSRDDEQRYRDEAESSRAARTERDRLRTMNRERRPLINTGEDDDDENGASNSQGGGFFSDFAERVGNTFETRFNMKTPDWVNRLSGGSDRASTSNTDGGGIVRLFGGRPADGRVRL